jgi:hypothetical protein
MTKSTHLFSHNSTFTKRYPERLRCEKLVSRKRHRSKRIFHTFKIKLSMHLIIFVKLLIELKYLYNNNYYIPPYNIMKKVFQLQLTHVHIQLTFVNCIYRYSTVVTQQAMNEKRVRNIFNGKY